MKKKKLKKMLDKLKNRERKLENPIHKIREIISNLSQENECMKSRKENKHEKI